MTFRCFVTNKNFWKKLGDTCIGGEGETFAFIRTSYLDEKFGSFSRHVSFHRFDEEKAQIHAE